MIPEEKKAFILSVIKNEGKCYPGMYYSITCRDTCALTGTRECFCDKDSYKVAVEWAVKNCKEELLEILI